MKNLILVLGLAIVFNAQADIEYSTNEPAKATTQEVSKSRACFEELNVQGCGDPGDDINHFRGCLKNVHSTLTVGCKKMMTDLYNVK